MSEQDDDRGVVFGIMCYAIVDAGVNRYLPTYVCTYSVDNLSLVIHESDCDHVCEKLRTFR